MFVFVLFILIGAALAGLNYWGLGLYHQWYWFWTVPLFWLMYFLATSAAYIVILYIFSLLIARDKDKVYPPSRPTMWIIKQTAFLILKVLRVKVHVKGLGKLPKNGVAMAIMHNHLSMFDEFVLASVLKTPLLFISKPSNLNIPVAGAFMRKAGYLPIIQGDMANGQKVIADSVELIKKGNSIVIAPEGTRNKDFPDPILLPFHAGSFHLALDSKAPIALFSLQNTNVIVKRFPMGTHVYLDCVGVIYEDEYASLSPRELADKCWEMIEKKLENKKARSYHFRKKNEKEED